MSYILDALKRADAERERGHVPGLHSQGTPAPAAGAARARRFGLPMMAGAIVLLLAAATAFAQAHETPWTRDPLREPQRFGVHHDDPPPWNRLRGPVHLRGPCSGVVWQHGVEIASWGHPGRSDQTFSVAKTCLALLAGVAQARGLLPDVDRPVAAQLPGTTQAP